MSKLENIELTRRGFAGVAATGAVTAMAPLAAAATGGEEAAACRRNGSAVNSVTALQSQFEEGMDDQFNDALLVRQVGRAFDIAGVHLVWKVRVEETGGRFCFFEQTLAPGEGVPLHRHGYTEVFYILSGTLHFRDHTGQVLTCSAGETVIASPEVAHSFVNGGPEIVRLLSIAPAAHQTFFDAVEDADHAAPFADMPPSEVMARVGMIGAETDTRFEPARDLT